MGQSVSSVIRAVDGEPCYEKRREAEDVLNTLIAVAEDKARIHQSRVSKCPIDGDVLPVERVFGKLYMVHCGVRKDPARVREVMGECLRDQVGGEIVDGLVAVTLRSVEKLTNVLNGKKSSELSSYAVMVGKSGRIGRLDCYFFYYRFGSRTIASKAEDCLITSLVFSSVESSRLHANDIRKLVEPAYSVSLPDEPREVTLQRTKAIEQQLLNALRHAPRHKSAPKLLAPNADILRSATIGTPRRPLAPLVTRALSGGRA